jgi:hypothetical protein
MQPTPVLPAEIAAWRAEIAEWPPALRRIAERFTPWAFVRLKSTGAIGRVHGFGEGLDGQVTVDVIVRERWNPHLDIGRDELVTQVSLSNVEMLQ